MGMIANQEMFFDAATDIKLEHDNMDQFIEMMMTQKDLMSHMEDDEIIKILKEIWHG